MMMTRSVTSDGLRRDLLQDHEVPKSTEYKSNFQEFDKYVYVDDVHGFKCRSAEPATSDTGIEGEAESVAGAGCKTWLDQVNERHGQAIVFAKRSYAGHPITGNQTPSFCWELIFRLYVVSGSSLNASHFFRKKLPSF